MITVLVSEGLLSESHEFLAFPVPGQDWEMGAGERVQAPPRAVARVVRQTEPGAWTGGRMAAGAMAGAWVLVLSLWGEPLPPPVEGTLPPPRSSLDPRAPPAPLPTLCQFCQPTSLKPLHLAAVSQGQWQAVKTSQPRSGSRWCSTVRVLPGNHPSSWNGNW